MSLGSPILVGIYENLIKIDSFIYESPASECILKALDCINKNYEINKIIYTNGPGSFMSLKLSYVILKSFSIVKNLEIYGLSGFELNNNSPIRANKNLCFVKDSGIIKLQKAEDVKLNLPDTIKNLNLEKNALPFYFIPEV